MIQFVTITLALNGSIGMPDGLSAVVRDLHRWVRDNFLSIDVKTYMNLRLKLTDSVRIQSTRLLEELSSATVDTIDRNTVEKHHAMNGKDCNYSSLETFDNAGIL